MGLFDVDKTNLWEKLGETEIDEIIRIAEKVDLNLGNLKSELNDYKLALGFLKSASTTTRKAKMAKNVNARATSLSNRFEEIASNLKSLARNAKDVEEIEIKAKKSKHTVKVYYHHGKLMIDHDPDDFLSEEKVFILGREFCLNKKIRANVSTKQIELFVKKHNIYAKNIGANQITLGRKIMDNGSTIQINLGKKYIVKMAKEYVFTFLIT
jgi:hypothetical protein